MNTRNYAIITGCALAAVALLGIVLSLVGNGGQFGLMCSDPSAATCDGDAAQKSFLGFDWTHNILHVVLAAVALYVGFMATANLQTLYAKVFGIVYGGLGIVGFVAPDLGVLHLELGENLIHLVIGAWGIAAGFFGTTNPTTTNTAPTPTTKTTPPRKA